MWLTASRTPFAQFENRQCNSSQCTAGFFYSVHSSFVGCGFVEIQTANFYAFVSCSSQPKSHLDGVCRYHNLVDCTYFFRKILTDQIRKKSCRQKSCNKSKINQNRYMNDYADSKRPKCNVSRDIR